MTTRTTIFAAMLCWVACSDDTNATRRQVSAIEEVPGANCPHGGVALLTGTDDDGNGVIEGGEVISTEYACNPSVTAIVVSSPEAAGTNCVAGGARLQTGVDRNADGTLTDAEIESTQYVCAVDPLAGRSFTAVRVTSAETLATAQTYYQIDQELRLTLPPATEAQTITFAALEVVRGTLNVECGGGTDLTLRFPKLVEVDDLFVSNICDGRITIDAPLLRTATELAFYTPDVVASFPELESVSYFTIQGRDADVSVPKLARVADMYFSEGNFDVCPFYDIAARSYANGVLTVVGAGSRQCDDGARNCPLVTIGSITDELRVCPRRSTWFDAQGSCRAIGAGWDLAYFTSDADFAAVGASPLSQTSLWIGYGDEGGYIGNGASEGVFRWVQNVAGNTYLPQGRATETDPFWGYYGTPESAQPDGGNQFSDCVYLSQIANGYRADDGFCSENDKLSLCRHLD